MNKIIIGLVALLAILVGGTFVVQAGIDKTDLYTTAEHVNTKDVFDKKGKNIFYFYQEQCSHCQDMKPTMQKFYKALTDAKTDVNFYLVDMAQSENSEQWYSGEDYTKDDNFKDNPADIKSIKDLQIVGTPTMVTIENGKVTNYGIGGTKIFDILEKYIKSLKLDVKLDRSQF